MAPMVSGAIFIPRPPRSPPVRPATSATPLDAHFLSENLVPESDRRITKACDGEDLLLRLQMKKSTNLLAFVEDHLVPHKVSASQTPHLRGEQYVVQHVLSALQDRGIRPSPTTQTSAGGLVVVSPAPLDGGFELGSALWNSSRMERGARATKTRTSRGRNNQRYIRFENLSAALSKD